MELVTAESEQPRTAEQILRGMEKPDEDCQYFEEWNREAERRTVDLIVANSGGLL